jgi:hypothetical protein
MALKSCGNKQHVLGGINVKKKLMVTILSCALALSLLGCRAVEPVQVNVSNNESISSHQLGTFISIGNNLVYDPATRIVYRKNYTYSGYYVYVPYYAQNGLPYRYNPETNTFEEINN